MRNGRLFTLCGRSAGENCLSLFCGKSRNSPLPARNFTLSQDCSKRGFSLHEARRPTLLQSASNQFLNNSAVAVALPVCRISESSHFQFIKATEQEAIS